MTLRCDHCRGKLGLIIHRYWHMRFCSAACAQAYQHRLNDETRTKIRRLDCGSREHAPDIRRRLRAIASLSRHFAG